MVEKFPEDRFDSVPQDLERVGAHRAHSRGGRQWIPFGIATLATILLAGIGIFIVAQTGNKVSQEPKPATTSAAETPEAVATIVPDIAVLVLNGTQTDSLASKAADKLKTAGVKADSTADAESKDVKTTTVFYGNSTLQGAARGVLEQLGVGTVAVDTKLTTNGTPLVVVLGDDYAKANS